MYSVAVKKKCLILHTSQAELYWKVLYRVTQSAFDTIQIIYNAYNACSIDNTQLIWSLTTLSLAIYSAFHAKIVER